jgi:hypothetical protein
MFDCLPLTNPRFIRGASHAFVSSLHLVHFLFAQLLASIRYLLRLCVPMTFLCVPMAFLCSFYAFLCAFYGRCELNTWRFHEQNHILLAKFFASIRFATGDRNKPNKGCKKRHWLFAFYAFFSGRAAVSVTIGGSLLFVPISSLRIFAIPFFNQTLGKPEIFAIMAVSVHAFMYK